MVVYLAAYAAVGSWTVSFYPSYAWPAGDEATYYSYALDPWRLVGGFFEGYRPKEVMNPYAFRLFLTPFSLVFSTVGFTVEGARLVHFAYGLALLGVMYAVGTRMAPPWVALAVVVVFSLSPAFLYTTHVVRPEGLLTLFIMTCIGLIVHRDPPVSNRTYFGVGFVSAAAIFVHYNGVVLTPIALVALLAYDWRGVRPHVSPTATAAAHTGGTAGQASSGTRRGVLSWFAGTGLVGVVFLLVNVWPARETIREFGWLPVTFRSQNQIPLWQEFGWARLVSEPAAVYVQYFSGKISLETETHWFSAALLPVAAFGLFYRAGRKERALGIVLGLTVLALFMVIPNLRDVYLYYLFPPVFVLAASGLGKLPRRWDMVFLGGVLLATIAAAYAWSDGRTLSRWHERAEANRRTEAELRRLVHSLGAAGEITVMAGQEFHAALHDTRFRTFHSILSTHDVGRSLRLIRPDIVVLHRRSLQSIGLFLVNEQFESGETTVARREQRIEQDIVRSILRQGFRLHPGAALSWDNSWVQVYVKERIER